MTEPTHLAQLIAEQIKQMPLDRQVITLNQCRTILHEAGPFSSEPVDLVLWSENSKVSGNDYNPNSVAPPEMKLLETSIENDGYTQPIVAWDENRDSNFVVVDGFHRHRVGKESAIVRDRVKGYLPVVDIRPTQADKGNRIASTIRHNRARGKHKVESMSEIVLELKRRNWTDARICKELGMDQDEVLRLCQITGLQELFGDADFSRSWIAEGQITEDDFQEITEEVDEDAFRTVPNTSDPNRVFHTYDKWECYKAGFFGTGAGMKKSEAETQYAQFLGDDAAFREGLEIVINSWLNSCDHYLTNGCMNRIAWLGQAAACAARGLPSCFRAGFFLLSEEQQSRANQTAYEYLCRYLDSKGIVRPSFEDAYSGRQSDIY